MNDIDEMGELVRFRADIAEPDKAVLARVRGRLVAATESRPAQAEPVAGRPGRRRRLGVRVAVAAGLAAAVTGGVLVTDTITHNGRPVTGASAAAAEQLNVAADHALQAKDPLLRPGHYLYTRTVEEAIASQGVISRSGGSVTETAAYVSQNVYEVWRPADWNGEWLLRRTDDAEDHVFRPGDEKKLANGLPTPTVTVIRARGGDFYNPAVAVAVQDPNGYLSGGQGDGTGGTRTGSWQAPTPEFMAGLPRDPRKLLNRIYADSRGHGPDPQTEAFVYVADILRTGVVPADLRAALFRAAALIPGVRIVDDAVNVDGRHGIAVARPEHGGMRVELVFDPATGEVIGKREVKTAADADLGLPAGATWDSIAVSSAVVDRIGQVPPTR